MPENVSIEAQEITVRITAASFPELRDKVLELAAFFAPTGQTLVAQGVPEGNNAGGVSLDMALAQNTNLSMNQPPPSGSTMDAPASADAAAPKRGRPRKTATEAATEAAGAAALTPPEPAPTPAPEPAPTPASSTEDPKVTLDKAIKEMQAYFGSNPAAMTHIKALQTKYGVKMFADVPLDKVASFYADVKLMVAGTPQV